MGVLSKGPFQQVIGIRAIAIITYWYQCFHFYENLVLKSRFTTYAFEFVLQSQGLLSRHLDLLFMEKFVTLTFEFVLQNQGSLLNV